MSTPHVTVWHLVGVALDAQRCQGCGEVVEDLGVVQGHPNECSLCAEADGTDGGEG